jgi:hypothetical protein
MDWTSLSSLYGYVGDYTTQLRRLEDYRDRKPTKPAPAFVLAYHYLVLSEKEAATEDIDKIDVKELPQIDLTGSWIASKGDSTIERDIDENASFTWIASSAGQQNAKLEGTITTAPDGIALETTSNGTLA